MQRAGVEPHITAGHLRSCPGESASGIAVLGSLAARDGLNMPIVRSAVAFFLFSLAASLAAAAPMTFEEISLSVRMDDGDASIAQQVSSRRLLLSLTPEQKAELKKEGASGALINTLDDPRFVLSDHEALAWQESRKEIQEAAAARAAADEAARQERAAQESVRAS